VIEKHRGSLPIAMMCRALAVSVSGYYASRSRPEPERATKKRRLTLLVRGVFKRKKGRYGSPRVTRELRTRGHQVGRATVAKIMRQEHLVARPRPRRVKTTDSSTTTRIAPNLLARNFTTDAVNLVWATDITYLATFAGRLYLAVVVDLFARRVVGWAIAPHMRTELVLEALRSAVRSRRPPAGLIHHSDRGSQYASDEYLAELTLHNMKPSMSRKGDCWDNAVVESFFATFKTELGRTFASLQHAQQATSEYVDFYNYERIHSSIGYVSPVAAELNPEPAALAA